MLLTPRLVSNNDTGEPFVLRKSGILGQLVYVIPRSECSFRRVELVNNGRNAVKAVSLKLQKETISPKSSFRIVPDNIGNRAGAWEFEKPQSEIGRVLPESLVRSPMEEGKRLIECLKGFEGQLWHQNSLISSRWWPKLPTEMEWLGFLRASASEIEVDLSSRPVAEQIAFRHDIPIWETDRERLGQFFSPVKILIFSFFVLGCMTMYTGGRYFHHWSDRNASAQKLEKFTDTTETILSHRSQALKNIKYVHKYNKHGHKGAMIIALGQVSEIVANENLLLSWIKYSNGELEIGLQGDLTTPIPEFVTALEAKPSLSNVSMDVKSKNLLTLNAEVDLVSDNVKNSNSRK